MSFTVFTTRPASDPLRAVEVEHAVEVEPVGRVLQVGAHPGGEGLVGCRSLVSVLLNALDVDVPGSDEASSGSCVT